MANLSQRKSLGQFWTPEPIAREMVGWVTEVGDWRVFLDPAVGPGVFIRSVVEQGAVSHGSNRSFLAFDLDPQFEGEVRSMVPREHGEVDFRCMDFLLSEGIEADAIVCNPPYLKHHHVPEKARAFEAVERSIGEALPRTIGAQGLFLLRALAALRPGGRLAFIMPSEFMNADYGVSLKRILLSKGFLRAVAAFDREHLVFEDALTTACVVFCERAANGVSPQRVLLARVSSAEGLQRARDWLRDEQRGGSEAVEDLPPGVEHAGWWDRRELAATLKWHRYFAPQPSGGMTRGTVSLGTIGRCTRGIATGANSFFLLTPSRAMELGLEEHELVRCIGRAADITPPVLTECMFAKLVEQDRPTLLLSLKHKDPSKGAASYLAEGEAIGLHERYLTRVRGRWFDVETREPPDFFVSVFFRGWPKVIRNEAGVVSLTAYHGVYLDPVFRPFAAQIVSYFQSPLGAEALLANRREYGGGLLKLEPRDVESAAIPLMPDLVAEAS